MCTAKSESEEKERKIYVFSFFSLFLFLFFFGFCKWKWQCESGKVNTGWPHDVTHRSIGVDMWVRVHSVPFRTLSSDEMTSQRQSQSQTATIATSTTAPHNHPVNLRCVLRGIKTKAFFTMRNLLLFFRFHSILFCSPFASVLHFCILTESLNWSDSSFPPFSVCLECVFIVATRSCHRRRPKLNHQPSTSPPPYPHLIAHLPSPCSHMGLIEPIDCLKYSVWNRSALQRSVH